MPQYTYTGEHPRILTGLAQSVNATHHPADGAPSDIPDGATIEVSRGDTVVTEDPYEVDGMVPVEPADAPEAARKSRKGRTPTPTLDSPAGDEPAADGDTLNGDAN